MPPNKTATAERTARPPAVANTERGLTRLAEQEAHPLVLAIEQRMPAIVQMLPAGMDAKRFGAVVLQAIVKQPDILTCTPESVIAAVLEAAQDGLEPTGARGGAHIVKFGNEAVLIRDYRGVIRILIESGAAKRVEAHEVRKGDHFALAFGVDDPVDHKPLIPNDGEILGYYALFWLADGGKQAEFMSADEIAAVKATSKTPGGLGWKTFPGQMARKTVIKRGSNYLNLRPEIRERLFREDDAEYGDAGVIVSRVPAADLAERRAAIAERTARLTGGTEQPEQEAPDATAKGGTNSPPVGQPPAPAPDAKKATPVTLEDAQGALHAAAVKRKLVAELPAPASEGYEAALAANWAVLDGFAATALPDRKPADLDAAGLTFVRERLEAGDFDAATA